MNDFTWTEIDGVPTVWRAAPGPLRASLQFGAGIADEAAPRRGINRLVAHLATRHTRVTPRVDLARTAFDVAGDDVPAALAALCAALHTLPEDVAAERAALEAMPAPIGYREALLYSRYGTHGPGLAGVHELGLRWLEGAHVKWWAGERFTRANAILWLTGPPPADLRLPLPAGHTPDPVRARAARKHTPHGWTSAPVQGFAVGAVLSRTSAWDLTLAAIRADLDRALHDEAGLTDGVVAGYDVVDADHVHVWLAAEGDPALRDALPAALQRATDRGPSEAALAVVRGQRAAFRDDVAMLDAAANDLIVGRAPETVAEWEARTAATTAAQVHGAAELFGRSELFLTPPGVGLPAPRYRPLPEFSTYSVSGETFPQAGFTEGPARSLVVGDEGMSVVTRHHAVSIRWPDATAVLCWSDGARMVYGRDGLVATIVPADYRDGARAVAAIDAAAPDVRVPIPGRSPASLPAVRGRGRQR